MMIKIVSAHQDELTYKKISFIINNEEHFESVGNVTNGYALFSHCGKVQPHLVIIESTLPGPSMNCLIDNIYLGYPRLNILLITNSVNCDRIRELAKKGVSGCILLDESDFLFSQAMLTVGLGGVWFSKPLFAKLLGEGLDILSNTLRKHHLTSREIEVSRLVAEGLSNKQIAESLNVKVRTTEFHITNILRKLHINNRVDLATMICRLS